MAEDEKPGRTRAAALQYRPPGDDAPRIVAKGAGELADRIIALAREHDIPIHEDPDLVTVLAQLDLEKEIPAELYKPIAEILSFVYRVNDKAKRPKGRAGEEGAVDAADTPPSD